MKITLVYSITKCVSSNVAFGSVSLCVVIGLVWLCEITSVM